MATTKEKMECAEREVIFRRRTYPRLVQKGAMKLEAAQRQIAIMTEIAADYRALASEEPMEMFIETKSAVKLT